MSLTPKRAVRVAIVGVGNCASALVQGDAVLKRLLEARKVLGEELESP